VSSPIVRRIEREAGVADLAGVLATRLGGADLTSLLLDVARRRSARRTPAELLAQHARDRTVEPSGIDARRLHRAVALALDAASSFEALELAPVAPLGLNAVLGGIDQNNALATVRGSEVLADPTTALALECARRRRAGEEDVRLCCASRLLRLQPFEGPALLQHFTVLALVSGGRALPAHARELGGLAEHLRTYLRLLAVARVSGAIVRVSDALVARTLDDLGIPRPPAAPDALDRLGDAASASPLQGRLQRLRRVVADVFPELARDFPTARLEVDLTREHALGYYDGLMLDVTVQGADGQTVDLADGGSVPWLGRLLADRRERLFVSGMGLDRLALAATAGLEPTC
jgi:hypothetical protein